MSGEDADKSFEEELDNLEEYYNMKNNNKEYASELEYLKWFRLSCDFGPGEGDYIQALHEEFEKETGKRVPKGWNYEEDEE